jgi:hypothetical protein
MNCAYKWFSLPICVTSTLVCYCWPSLHETTVDCSEACSSVNIVTVVRGFLPDVLSSIVV